MATLTVITVALNLTTNPTARQPSHACHITQKKKALLNRFKLITDTTLSNQVKYIHSAEIREKINLLKCLVKM
jgi:hypothetical protein